MRRDYQLYLQIVSLWANKMNEGWHDARFHIGLDR